MPRQNRVTPRGEIVSTPARGTLMGNRGGCLHDAAGRLGVSRWRSRQWIVCLLEFKGWQRTVMTPGRYTELFFLDEATALAAGHRPCSECQRGAFNRFKQAWLRGNARPGRGSEVSAPELDRQLHRERVTRTRQKVTARAPIDGLPAGVFVTLPGEPGESFLVQGDRLLRWSPDGYAAWLPRPEAGFVEVLTPLSTVRAIAAGYSPHVHETSNCSGSGM